MEGTYDTVSGYYWGNCVHCGVTSNIEYVAFKQNYHQRQTVSWDNCQCGYWTYDCCETQVDYCSKAKGFPSVVGFIVLVL